MLATSGVEKGLLSLSLGRSSWFLGYSRVRSAGDEHPTQHTLVITVARPEGAPERTQLEKGTPALETLGHMSAEEGRC